ncbi:MAG: putative nucleotidyltransferase substrate binding domain-containing protein, partial [Bacteroidota bacterium]
VVLRLPTEEFRKLNEKYDVIQQYMVSLFGQLMLNRRYAEFVLGRDRASDNSNIEGLFTRRLTTVSLRPLITCAPDLPIHRAAMRMEEYRTSCVLVEHRGELVGYVTDIILRNKVIALRRSVDDPISSIMETPVVSISRDSFAYETILMMFEESIRYLVVTNERDEPVGLLTRNDLLKDHGQSPFLYLQALRNCEFKEQLAVKWQELPEVIHHMVQSAIRPEILNLVISRAAEVVFRKTIEICLSELPPSPTFFAIVSVGNLGRAELMLDVTQKIILIFEENSEFEAHEIRKYFELLMLRAADHLRAIGIRPASNRFFENTHGSVMSLGEWTTKYQKWVHDTSAVNIYPGFFDLRFLMGDEHLFRTFRSTINDILKRPGPTFFSRLAQYTLAYDLPLTFFRGIKTVSKGDREVFDIYQAIGVLVDFTRYHALRNGIVAANTAERLEELRDNTIMQSKVYNELVQSFYYLMGISLKYQAKQVILDDEPPDTFIDTGDLTTIEMITLKEIFGLIEEFRQGFKNLPLRLLGRTREL